MLLIVSIGVLTGCKGAQGRADGFMEAGGKAEQAGNLREAMNQYKQAVSEMETYNAERQRKGKTDLLDVAPALAKLRQVATGLANAAVARGDELVRAHDLDGAVRSYGDAITLAREGRLNVPEFEAKVPEAHRTQANHYVEQGNQAAGQHDFPTAVNHMERAVSTARTGNIPTEPYTTHLNNTHKTAAEWLLADGRRLLTGERKPHEALARFEQAKGHATNAGIEMAPYTQAIADGNKACAEAERARGDSLVASKPVEAIAAYESALRFAQAANLNKAPFEAKLNQALQAASRQFMATGDGQMERQEYVPALGSYETANGYQTRARADNAPQLRAMGRAATEAAKAAAAHGEQLMQGNQFAEAKAAFASAVSLAKRGNIDHSGYESQMKDAHDGVQRQLVNQNLASARQVMPTDPPAAWQYHEVAKQAHANMHSRAGDLAGQISQVGEQISEHQHRIGAQNIQSLMNQASRVMATDPGQAERLLGQARGYLSWVGNDRNTARAIEQGFEAAAQARRRIILGEAQSYIDQAKSYATSNPDHADVLLGYARAKINEAGGDTFLWSATNAVESEAQAERNRRWQAAEQARIAQEQEEARLAAARRAAAEEEARRRAQQGTGSGGTGGSGTGNQDLMGDLPNTPGGSGSGGSGSGGSGSGGSGSGGSGSGGSGSGGSGSGRGGSGSGSASSGSGSGGSGSGGSGSGGSGSGGSGSGGSGSGGTTAARRGTGG